MEKNISEYIINYIKNKKGYIENSNVVEVGIGYYFKVAKILKGYGIEVTVVDIKREVVERAKRAGLNAQLDDIFNPKLEVYKYADLIYSIRPPRDLQHQLLKISKNYEVPLLIRPLSGEYVIDGLKLVNYGGEVLYIYER
ncbi:MAG TPA: hypothetical protein EYG87_03040 [Methanothermococcus okinawensis]|uniref:UPF0146 protein MHHB_P0139 n=1 Tax=Methanofervidicoccus abyssi TaxID=2082189 RepID=A0A401HNS9_9EURY|nr:UPF0146 family protein [Methanofervidicoccus abyssi]GBF35914.1 conserved hypothetical protein [Methanofervidicoccus abyssi]HIP15814.1 hypothetical protein [Methanothermococcus okinawensis]HIP35007.1 hypothetical protein [Methanothermococcus okinawensis]